MLLLERKSAATFERKITMFAVVVVVALALANIPTPVHSSIVHDRIVCYYTNWAQYRSGVARFTPKDIIPGICTHLIYAFGTIKYEGEYITLQAKEWNDESTEYSKGMMAKFNDIKKKDPKVKTLLAIGGWKFGTGMFTRLVSTPDRILYFAKQAVVYLRAHDFDGLDLDWEYPANRGSPPEDKHRFTELVKVLKRQMALEAQRTGNPTLMLTAAVSAGRETIKTAYEISEICYHLNFISVMTYDLHGSWEKVTGHSSPLYGHEGETGSQRFLNTNNALLYWARHGCSKHKLIIGLAFYGRSFTLTDRNNNGLGAPIMVGGLPGKLTKEVGFLAFTEVCQMSDNGGTEVYIEDQKTFYMYKGRQWVGYDNEASLAYKVCYAKKKNFGGIMIWSLDFDDFTGTVCNRGIYPFLKAAANALASETTECLPPDKFPTYVKPKSTKPPSTTTTPEHPPENHKESVNTACRNKPTGLHPDMLNCKRFYQCANGMAYHLSCPGRLVFNLKINSCDFDYNVPRCQIG